MNEESKTNGVTVFSRFSKGKTDQDIYDEHEKLTINESFTIKELMEVLAKYPQDMKIITTWESTIKSIKKRDIYLSKDGKFVYLDADYCSYKEAFAKDPCENQRD